MTEPLLNIVSPSRVERRRDTLDGKAIRAAADVICAVRARGEPALREFAERSDHLAPAAPLFLGRGDLDRAYAVLPYAQRELLTRTALRIQRFAEAQRGQIHDLTVNIPGGQAGHFVRPVQSAGCHVPGGRFPLPATMLMAVVTAKAAGVPTVWAATPHPTAVTLAAASVAGADGVLAAGGAPSIAALAYGVGPVPRCDVVVGPGDHLVTAAKFLVSPHTGIDMLNGSTELVVLADGQADSRLVAADLLAQAEHDPDAFAVLLALSVSFVDQVNRALHDQLTCLPTAETARAALGNAVGVVVSSIDEALALCDRLAPQQAALHLTDADAAAHRLRHFGVVYVGSRSAAAYGEGGAGPNHLQPTHGGARFASGLSVRTFLRFPTWVRVDDDRAGGLRDDVLGLSEVEGLAAHARSVSLR